MNPPAHQQDFHAWALHNAHLLRLGRLDEIDLDNIAEELDDLEASKERE